MRLSARIAIWAVILVAAWWAISARADQLDLFNKQHIEKQCGWKVRAFLTAVESRETGHSRKIIHIDKELMEEWIASGRVKRLPDGQVVMPKDGMYVPNWNNLSQREKDFIAKWVYYGWDMADAWIKAGNEAMVQREPEWAGKLNAMIAPETKGQWAQDVWEQCLYEYGKEKASKIRINFIKTQSEELGAPKTPEYDSYGLWNRIKGCMLNRGIYFHKCMEASAPSIMSQNDMYRAAEACDMKVVDKFLDCAGLVIKNGN